MAVVETRVSLWEALAGRAPGQPSGPADPGLWTAVAERVNPARARPVLRPGVEESNLVSARGVAYVMLRSPDQRRSCYVRLTPEEMRLAHLMDGTRTLARLVAEFARITGRLAPDQVRRVVADLAGNRMLEELPVDAFAPLRRVVRRPWPLRLGSAMLAFARGRRMVIANIDPVIGLCYRAGGRLLFTRPVAALLFAVAAVGMAAFGWQWWAGAESIFLTNDSYVTGAAALLGLNVVALACHEFGHALATKHAGRAVPAAGFLVYFGIPSVFVDTTDVWMAGRRGRMLTTAAGPLTGLVLAGASALVGFTVPEAAPWCFKLSFAWYLNALFNLNPFLALDGYYLLMDWLEVPNLRARGLAWVAARLRRRPPAWSSLDREGRLVALYGMLAVGWLAIAVNIGYRVYVDRVGGLITGLWGSGWTARGLLAVVLAVLVSPLVYVVAGWVTRRMRRARQRLAERRVHRDAPRRLDALRATSLRDLPAEKLTSLANQARWVHPRSGQQLVFADSAPHRVFVVVDGAMEGRVPGDPPGTVRERVGPGGVVGLGAVIAGTTSPLAWFAAGTRLLAVPAAAVAGAVATHGVAMKGAYGTASEADALFRQSPAMAGLSHEDRLALAAAAIPQAAPPDASISLRGPDDAIVLAAGVVTTSDGQQLGRGTLIGPAGEDHPRPVAVARTPVRFFSVAAMAGLPALVGAGVNAWGLGPAGSAPGRAPLFGVHPPTHYPPLAVPPGPPPPVEPGVDGRFEKRLRWLLILLLLFALLFTAGNFLVTTPAWAEMPTDHALMRIERGTATVVVSGESQRVVQGDDVYVGIGDDVLLDPGSRGTLVFRGGASTVLCSDTQVRVGAISSSTRRPAAPQASLSVVRGLALVDTTSTSPAFAPLDSSVQTAGGAAVSVGPAWFAVAPSGVAVADGTVTFAGSLLAPVDGELSCGDGEVVPRPSTPTPSPDESPSNSPTVILSVTPSGTTTPSPGAVVPTVGPRPSPSSKPTSSPTASPSPTTTPGPTDNPPVVTWVTDPGGNGVEIQQDDPACGNNATRAFPVVSVTDDHDPPGKLRVVVYWSGFRVGSDAMSADGNFYGTVGPLAYDPKQRQSGSLRITVRATDSAGNTAEIAGTKIKVLACP